MIKSAELIEKSYCELRKRQQGKKPEIFRKICSSSGGAKQNVLRKQQKQQYKYGRKGFLAGFGLRDIRFETWKKKLETRSRKSAEKRI